MLSKAAQAICAASVCLAATTTTTTTEAFLVPPLAVKGITTARGHHQRQRSGASCARCNTTPVVRSSGRVTATTTTMRGDLDNDNRRSKLSVLRKRLLSRKRGSSTQPLGREGDVSVAPGAEDEGDSARVGVQGRVREVMRRSFVALMTSFIIRSSFNPQAASAVGMRPKLGARTSRQLREKEGKKAERIRAQVEKEQQQMLDAATSDLNGEISEEQAAAAAEAAGGQTEGQLAAAAGAAAATAGGATTTSRPSNHVPIEELIAKIRALQTPHAQEHAMKKLIPEDYTRVWQSLTTAQRTAITRYRVENKTFKAMSIGDAKRNSKRNFAPVIVAFSSFLIIKATRGSIKVMNKQRKRVKIEAAKFDIEQEEFMNVDGEAEFDVDIMKELRDMKEKMAGPGDKYAKDTRAYNPEFAAKAGDEAEYDKKIQEALKGTGKGSKSNKGETRKVFTKDGTVSSAGGDADLLRDDGGAAGGAAGSAAAGAGMGQDDAKADPAAQAKKSADAKRLESLFNNSSIDEPDEPDEGLGDKRELLP